MKMYCTLTVALLMLITPINLQIKGGHIWMKCYYENVSAICSWNGPGKSPRSAKNNTREVCNLLVNFFVQQDFCLDCYGLYILHQVMNDAWCYKFSPTRSPLLIKTERTVSKETCFTLLLALHQLVEQIHCNFCKLCSWNSLGQDFLSDVFS